MFSRLTGWFRPIWPCSESLRCVSQQTPRARIPGIHGPVCCVLRQNSSVLGSTAVLQRSSVKRQYLQIVGQIYHCYYSNIPRLKRFAMENVEFYHPVDRVFNLVSHSLKGNNRLHTIILNTIQNLLLFFRETVGTTKESRNWSRNVNTFVGFKNTQRILAEQHWI